MPLFFQHVIDESTQLALWKIEEEESFFTEYVPLQRTITHPHKRLQHLAGRYLLQYLYPDFPVSLIQIADTRKPYLQDEAYHFSISHCGDYAGVIVSKTKRVGIDIELVNDKIERIRHKFLEQNEWNDVSKQWGAGNKQLAIGNEQMLEGQWTMGNESLLEKSDIVDAYGSQLMAHSAAFQQVNLLTLLWSCKEAAFKWYGLGEVDFRRHMEVKQSILVSGHYQTSMIFKKNEDLFLDLHSFFFNNLVLSYVVT